MPSIRSPLRYAGGKWYARKLILDRIPPFHNKYYEPFVGGGSIFFAKDKALERNVINDADADLVLVYQTIRDQPQQLIEFLAGKAATRENHKYYKNEFQPANNIERAGRWYYLNRISYSGIMNPPNCYWGYAERNSMPPEHWPRAILPAADKLQGVDIHNLDFEMAIDQAEDGAFLFVDPPYYNADQNKFYSHSFKLADHLRLAACLQRNADRLQFLLTYDSCVEVKGLYDWAVTIDEMEWTYCLSRTDDQKTGSDRKGARENGKEVFIANYNFCI